MVKLVGKLVGGGGEKDEQVGRMKGKVMVLGGVCTGGEKEC